MSKDKYPSIFSRQMSTIVSITLQVFFATRAILKIGEYLTTIHLSFGGQRWIFTSTSVNSYYLFPNFQNRARWEKDLKDNKNNSLHLGRKYARIFVLGHYLFLVAHNFPRATLSENCSVLATDNVRGQISKHIFAQNGGYCSQRTCYESPRSSWSVSRHRDLIEKSSGQSG